VVTVRTRSKKAQATLKIDDDAIDMLDAAFATIASFAFLGVRKLRLELGESAVIVGQGILGVFALQVALLSGAIPVVVSDLDPRRRALALQLGAARAFSPDEEGFVEKVKEATGGSGPNAIVEVTGPPPRCVRRWSAWRGGPNLASRVHAHFGCPHRFL
jgi:threonine dehydrogenase-like Zn-dependent dehydrogenase